MQRYKEGTLSIYRMNQEGSIRNTHRETTPVKRKVAPRAVQDAARQLVEHASHTGIVIRQHLDIERMKQPLQKGVFYVAENEGNAEPGFLVFLPKGAPVFLQMKKHAFPPCTLRMRVSQELGEGGGSVFIATFDTIQHSLRIEDVWMWKGSPVFDTSPYSVRRTYLSEFVERLWVPDTRLMGGVNTTILNPKSVDSAFTAGFTGIHTIDLIPELAGRRRMWTECNSKPVAKEVVPSIKINHVVSTPSKLTDFKARAVPVDSMPDIYDLYDEMDNLVGRGSVQMFSLSQLLRGHTESIVQVRWNTDFSGYEIYKKISPIT
jgi:hypothetical protein